MQQQKDGTSRIKTMMKRRARSNTGDTETGPGYEVMEKDAGLPAPVRRRLHVLFEDIEREFEKLYTENVNLQKEVEYLTDKLATGSEVGEKESLENPDGIQSIKAKKSSHLGQKIKSTYKVSTSRLASTFKQTSSSNISSLAKEFRGHRDGVWEVNVSRSGQKVIGTASADYSARLWSVETGQCVLTYLGHSGSVNAIRFHPSQDLVLTASGDQMAHVWRKPADFDSLTLKHSSEDEIDVSEKDDGSEATEFLDGAETSHVRTPLTELDGHKNVIIAADWLASGSHVITGSWDRTAHVYDVEKKEVIQTLTGHELELTNVSCHPSQQLVITSSKDATFRLADLRNPSMKLNVFQGHTQSVTTAIFANGDKIVSGSDDRTVKIWDLKNMLSPIATIRTDSSINRLAVSLSNSAIAIPQDNRHVRLYDFNGVRLGRLPKSNRLGHRRMVCAVAWDEDNLACNLFSCGFDRQVLGWSVNLHA